MNTQNKNLKKYIIPAVISNASFFILTIVDGMFVGNGVGTDALGAVSIAMPFVMLVGAISVLFTIGGVAVAAVRLGRGDTDGANLAFMHSFSAIISIFVILSLTGTIFADKLSLLLGANETYHKMVSDYIFYYSLFLVPAGLYTCLAGFCRNDGVPKLTTYAALICTSANIFGDWLMVYPLKMGVGGAALASGLSQVLSVILLLSHFIRKKGQLRICRFKPSAALYKKIIVRGVPELVSQFAAPVTTYSMNRILLMLGDSYVNAFSVIGYAGSLCASITYGLSAGLQPLYGLSYGAKDDKSLRYYIKSGVIMSLVGGTALFIITFIIGKPVCTIFGADASTVAIVVDALPKYCLNYIFAAFNAVIASYLFSTKRTQYALPLNICRSLIFNFICINFLPFIFGMEFVWYTVSIAEALCMIIAVILWKTSEKNGIVYK